MKKLLFTFISMLLPIMANADAVEINGVYYNLVTKAKEAKVTSNPKKYSGKIEIPTTVTYKEIEYKVTSIEDYTFGECSNLTSVIIPNSINSIGNYAFYCCDDLISVTIPNSVTSIGYSAFEECSNLTSLTIGNGVKTIGSSAFNGCENLTSVNISDLSAWCNILFGEDADNPLECAHHLFLDGKEIKDLVIPNSVTSIGDYAFRGCTGLTSVTIPNSVTSIGVCAFCGCKGLNSVTIPISMTSIGACAFRDCNSLTSVAIPNSVKEIGNEAFSGCRGITSMIISNSVTLIRERTFAGCSGLTSVTIPNNVALICKGAFGGCSGLTSMTIPNSVAKIDEAAFSGCSGLTSVTIPNSVKSIYNNAFEGCTSLNSVNIGNGVTSIGTNAFGACEGLTDVYCHAEVVPITSAEAFKDSYPQYITLHVPTVSVEAYRISEPWSGFKKVVALDDNEIPQTSKCSTPEISYANGEITFSCKTDGVEYISEITITDAKKYYDSRIKLSQKYKVSVYATKKGYENSEVATKEIEISGNSSLPGDLNGDGVVNVADHVKLSDIILKKAE